MTTARVTVADQVYINAIRYPIKGPIISTLSSFSQVKRIRWDDWTSGIGIERITEEDLVEGAYRKNRAWWSRCDLNHRGHLILGPLSTATDSTPGTFIVGSLAELSNEIYKAQFFGGTEDVYKYNNSTDSWGSSLNTLPARAVGSLSNFRLDGTVYMAFAHTGGYTFTSDGSTYFDSTQDTTHMAFWHSRLWGISANGQLWYTYGLGTADGAQGEVNAALLPVPDNYITSLFVGPDADGNDILYATALNGLWAHDLENNLWVETALDWPRHPYGGRGSIVWRGAIYIPVGQTIFKYTPNTPEPITVIGPDRDDGLHLITNTNAPWIFRLVGSRNELLARVATDGPTSTAHVLAWNGQAWSIRHTTAGGGTVNTLEPMLVSNAYDTYRIWWVSGGVVRYQDLPPNIINPNVVTPTERLTVAEHITPVFDIGAYVIGLALAMWVEVKGTASGGSAEDVEVFYDINETGTFTSHTLITADGTTELRFPDNTTPTGTAFRTIQFELDLERGGTTTNTPDVLDFTFEYLETQPVKWTHRVTLDLSSGNGYMGQSQELMFENIRIAEESNSLIEFTFRDRDADDAGNANPYNYLVNVRQAQGTEYSGQDWNGEIQLELNEV